MFASQEFDPCPDLVANVAGVARLFCGRTDGAQSEDILLAEAHLVVHEEKLGLRGHHAQRRRATGMVVVVVCVLDELEHEVDVARVELTSQPIDCAHLPRT